MKPVLTVEQIRAAEQAHPRELADGTLMRRAALALEHQVLRVLRSTRGRVRGARIAVLAGRGSNAGDALFAAAGLAARGCRVDVIPVWGSTHEGGLAACAAAGGRITDAPEAVDRAEVILDGLIGIGGRGSLRAPADAWARRVNSAPGVVIAVDIPSGVDADTGEVHEPAIHADETVTFAALKPGLVTGPGRACAGEVVVVDIGIAHAVAEVVSTSTAVIDLADVRAWLPDLDANAHKYRRGVVGLAVGSDRYPGAGALAVRAAATGLAGMVMVLEPQGAELVVPDAVPVASIAEAQRVTAWAIGSGWQEPDRAVLDAVWASDKPVVADGGALVSGLRRRSAPTVLTPHEGEFTRMLVGVDPRDRLRAARSLADATGAVVLLKGPGTVIADPDGQVLVDACGGPDLAVAGSGDVLTGLIGSLLAAGLPPLHAAAAGASVHAVAGQLAAEDGRPVSASALIDALPGAVAAIRGGRTARMGR